MTVAKEKSITAAAPSQGAETLDLDTVKVGDMLQMSYWGIVRDKQTRQGETSLQMEPVTPGISGEFFVNGSELVKQAGSADYFDPESVVKCNQGELVNYFLIVASLPVTVCFTKQNGNQRVLRGRVISASGPLGQSLVEDLDLPISMRSRIRTVIHRQINWFVANGLRYELKTGRRATAAARQV